MKELPQEIRNAILCEWAATSANLVFRALGKRSKNAKLMERGLYFDFAAVLDSVLAIYKDQHCPSFSRLRPVARPAFFELATFIEDLDCRDAHYFLDALSHFKNTDRIF
jgi:hypothetical protein